MSMTKTRLTTGDLQREFGISRSQLDRILRDWARELPEPEIVGGSRLWKSEDLEAFRSVISRDRERIR